MCPLCKVSVGARNETSIERANLSRPHTFSARVYLAQRIHLLEPLRRRESHRKFKHLSFRKMKVFKSLNFTLVFTFCTECSTRLSILFQIHICAPKQSYTETITHFKMQTRVFLYSHFNLKSLLQKEVYPAKKITFTPTLSLDNLFSLGLEYCYS